jgi:aminoglycoside phosphotransferase (APT) family kinase protein
MDPTVEPARLTAALAAILGLAPADVHLVGRAGAGASNVSLFVRAGGRDVVVRLPPPSATGAARAHDVAREHRFLTALWPTTVPVPEPLALVEDPEVLGRPFLVMANVDGRALHDPDHPTVVDHPAVAASLSDDAVDVLAALHDLVPAAIGVDTPSGDFLQRQIRRWRGVLAELPTAARLAGLDRLTTWIERTAPPAGPAAVVHGDYGFHNLLVGGTPPRVLAVVDWELATVGDAHFDLANLLKSWGDPPLSPVGNPANEVLARAGAPSAEALVERYAAARGIARPDLSWHLAFCLWRSAAVSEGVWARHRDRPNPTVARLEHSVPTLVTRALELTGA